MCRVFSAPDVYIITNSIGLVCTLCDAKRKPKKAEKRKPPNGNVVVDAVEQLHHARSAKPTATELEQSKE